MHAVHEGSHLLSIRAALGAEVTAIIGWFGRANMSQQTAAAEAGPQLGGSRETGRRERAGNRLYVDKSAVDASVEAVLRID